MSVRDLTRYTRFSTRQYDDLSGFLISSLHDGITSVGYKGGIFDLLVRKRHGAATTIIMFHGATSRDATRPVFTGLGVTRGLNANIVFVSDPTLELFPRLTNAWFAGSSVQPLQEDLPRILRHICNELEAEHIVFYGSSGGGFAALFYSALFPRSLALPVNPQTILENFWPRTVLNYVEECFGAVRTITEATDLLQRRGIVCDLCEYYADGHQNAVGYIQNARDTRHVEMHMVPFESATSSWASVRYLLGSWGPGHSAPPKEVSRSVLVAAAEANGDWHRMLDSLRFVPELPKLLR